MNELQVFENHEFGKVRSMCINGEPWFVGKDVANALGYSNSRKTLADHIDSEDKGVTKCDTLGGTQEITIINESGLYSLIMGSKLPSAKKFKRWVTSEVLPAIRKTGQYQVQPYPPKSSSIGEIVQLGKFIKQLMKEQQATPYEIAEVVFTTMKQFGISITDKMLLPVRLEKLKEDELDMVEYSGLTCQDNFSSNLSLGGKHTFL